MRPRNRTLMVLFATLFLATVSQPASALLYGGYGAPIVGDATGDSKAANPSGGTDIAALYFANNGGFHFFRMDLNGAVTTTDLANYYNIIFNSSNSSNINGLTAVGVPFAVPFTMVNISPAVSDFRFSEGNKLEWKIPETQLVGAFSIMGLTFSTASPFTLDTTKTVITPIPSAVWLIGSGVLGLIGLQRRRGRKA